MKLEAHLAIETDDAPSSSSAVDRFSADTNLSRQQIKSAMTKGAAWLTRGKSTQRLRRAKRRLLAGDEIHLYFDSAILAEEPFPPTLIADAKDYSVWHKPYGLRSQGSKWGDHCTVVRWVETHHLPQRPAFTVHRLDRAATGLILIAHSKKTAAALSALFSSRSIEKRYRAIVRGDASKFEQPLRLDSPIDGKQALSEMRCIEYDSDTGESIVEVRIETGRKHQIRRHLSDAGLPISGDRLYGAAAPDDRNLQLTACFLSFVCPMSGQTVTFRSET